MLSAKSAVLLDGAEPTPSEKSFAAFLSHYKLECGTEARLVHEKLKPLLGAGQEVFLDSDDLQDLRRLLEHVKDSKVIVLLQSKNVLTRPWVILEIYTAITHGVPVVALNVQNAFPYSYPEALELLNHFDEEIEIANPGAAQLLMSFGVDPQDVAYRLSEVIPSIISTDFNPNASSAMLGAMMADLKQSIERAVPLSTLLSKEDWLVKRASSRSASARPSAAAHEHGRVGTGDASSAQPVGAAVGASIPSSVPELPGAYLPRPADLAALKVALLSKQQQTTCKTCAYGMGGVGKTTVAVNLAATLANDGAKVGILDIDIDCPNVVRAMNLSEQPLVGEDKKMLPPERFGVTVMSMAFFQENENEAIIWRGPMIHNAINQMLQSTDWGDLDYLFIDLPPGTSDAPLTIMQVLTMDGFVVVTTPQELAKVDAKRSINMIRKLQVNVLGVVENMSGGVFGSGAGEEISNELDLDF